MKFSGGKFFRQRGDCCLFIEVLRVLSDDGQMAELQVTWNRQLHLDWRVMSTEYLKIRSKDYNNWTSYFPRGNKLSHAS